MKYKLSIFLILLITFIGCARGGSIIPAYEIDNQKVGKILDNYIIQPGDSLLIDIMENTNTSRSVTVRPDGKISLPQINDIQAAGLSTLKLRENLIKKYGDFYNIVEVSVTLTASMGYKIDIIGNVRRPGRIILNDKTTFLEAISLAGGLGEWANPKKIYIIREMDGEKKRIKVNYTTILEGKDKDIWILPGDIISVP